MCNIALLYLFNVFNLPFGGVIAVIMGLRLIL